VGVLRTLSAHGGTPTSFAWWVTTLTMTAWARTAFDDHSYGEGVASNAEQVTACPQTLTDGVPSELSLACKVRPTCPILTLIWVSADLRIARDSLRSYFVVPRIGAQLQPARAEGLANRQAPLEWQQS